MQYGGHLFPLQTSAVLTHIVIEAIARPLSSTTAAYPSLHAPAGASDNARIRGFAYHRRVFADRPLTRTRRSHMPPPATFGRRALQ
jgi:hypothetical protein